MQNLTDGTKQQSNLKKVHLNFMELNQFHCLSKLLGLLLNFAIIFTLLCTNILCKTIMHQRNNNNGITRKTGTVELHNLLNKIRE